MDVISVRRSLLEYCKSMGITTLLQNKTVLEDSLHPQEERKITLGNDTNWLLQRPNTEWNSNMHWLSPLDQDAHNTYLDALQEGHFLDDVVTTFGTSLGLDGLVACQLTFIALTPNPNPDSRDTGDKVWNFIIPLLLPDERNGPDLLLQNDERDRAGGYQYEYDVAAAMGDDTWHATAPVDFRDQKQMRLAATVYLMDVNEDNVEVILTRTLTQPYPPPSRKYFLSLAGHHWKSNSLSSHRQI